MSSEAIRSLHAKKRLKHKVLITENDPAPLTRSHLIQKDTPVPCSMTLVTRHTRANSLSQQHDAIDHETRKSQWHFTTKADVRLLLLAAFFEFTHRDCST